MKSTILRGLKMLWLPALFVVFTVGVVSAAALQRLSAEFQVGEISTTATPTSGGGGGTVVYDKQLSLPQSVAYISFSAQGDTHGGASLKMTATVTPTDVSGTPTGDPVLCQPVASGVGATSPSGWYTLNKLPTDADWDLDNNCNNGGGGSADCHDNTIYFSCCVLVTPDGSTTNHRVKIKLATSGPSDEDHRVFYEDSTIYIDSGPNPGGNSMCNQVGTAPH